MNIQKRLRYAMDQAGVSNTELAQHVGVSVQAVGKWLKKGTIKKDHLPVIAKLTGVDFQWLSTGEKSPTSESFEIGYFGTQESIAEYGTTESITPDMIKPLLPSAGMDTVFLIVEILNDLRSGHLSEADFNLIKPFVRRMKER